MHLKYKINLRACNDNWMLDDTKLKNCGLRNASKFPLNENVKFNEQIFSVIKVMAVMFNFIY